MSDTTDGGGPIPSLYVHIVPVLEDADGRDLERVRRTERKRRLRGVVEAIGGVPGVRPDVQSSSRPGDSAERPVTLRVQAVVDDVAGVEAVIREIVAAAGGFHVSVTPGAPMG